MESRTTRGQGCLEGVWLANTTKKREKETGEKSYPITSLAAAHDLDALHSIVSERCEQLKTDHMETYHKGAATNWCQAGESFVQGIEDMEGGNVRYPGWVTQELATIVGKHDKNEIEHLSARASRLLDRIVDLQPPVVVHGVDTSNDGSGSKLMLKIQDNKDKTCVWLPLNGQVSSAPAGLQATRGYVAPVAEIPIDGIRFMLLLAQDCHKLLDDTWDNPETAEASVKQNLGRFLLLRYMLTVFNVDLEARMQVAQAHLGKKVQLANVQVVLADSLLHRALLVGAADDLKRFVVELSEMVTIRSEQWELHDRSSDPPSAQLNPQCTQLHEDIRQLAVSYLEHIFGLLGAMEDAGCFTSSACVTIDVGTRVGVRVMLDNYLIAWFKSSCSCSQKIDRLLHALPERDRMRFITSMCAELYSKLEQTNKSNAVKLGADWLLMCAKMHGNGNIYLKPATYVDIPPSSVLKTLMSQQLWRAAMKYSIDVVVIMVYHLCSAAASEVASIASESRFVMDDARPPVCHLNAGMGQEFKDTHRRFESQLPAADKIAVAHSELSLLLADVQMIQNQYIRLEGSVHVGSTGHTSGQESAPASQDGSVVDMCDTVVTAPVHGVWKGFVAKKINYAQYMSLTIARLQLEAAIKRLS